MNVGFGQTLLLGSLDATGNVMTGVTTGTSQWIPASGRGTMAFYFRSLGTTSGGTILIEEADWMPNEDPYSGTWFQVASVSASAFTGGAQAVTRPTIGAYGFVRVRISAAITGGGSIAIILRTEGTN